MNKNSIITLLFALAGVVVGQMVATVTAGVPYLSLLAYGLDFGTTEPFILDLSVITLTFGINLRITISTIIFTAMALILKRAVTKR